MVVLLILSALPSIGPFTPGGLDALGAAMAVGKDPAALVAYNLQDARLVLEILARTGLVELAVRRSLLTGMQLDRVSAQVASVDSLYLGALRARGRVAPSLRRKASLLSAWSAGWRRSTSSLQRRRPSACSSTSTGQRSA